jgi:hypothetical protein
MTTQNSDFLALVDAVSPGLVSGCGPVKRYPFTFTQVGAGGGAGDIARRARQRRVGGLPASGWHDGPGRHGGIFDGHQLSQPDADCATDDRDGRGGL